MVPFLSSGVGWEMGLSGCSIWGAHGSFLIENLFWLEFLSNSNIFLGLVLSLKNGWVWSVSPLLCVAIPKYTMPDNGNYYSPGSWVQDESAGICYLVRMLPLSQSYNA